MNVEKTRHPFLFKCLKLHEKHWQIVKVGKGSVAIRFKPENRMPQTSDEVRYIPMHQAEELLKEQRKI